MMQNSPTSIVMQYMQGGADIKTALSQAAQQHPDMFPQPKVSIAMSFLSKPVDSRRQVLANMAKERGIDLKEYTAQLQEEARKATLR